VCTKDVAVGILCVLLSLSCVSTGSVREVGLMTAVFPSAEEVRVLEPAVDESGVLAVRAAVAGGRVVGYGVTERVSGRSGPFTILVVVDTELTVHRVAILSYPWDRGRDVQSPKFTNQFAGKGPGDPLRMGKDIDAMTGATISSRAVTDGVRHALGVVRDIGGRQP
jgi:Na+-translocating ferredoxin:NAD+ oxidoreductase RnfG subunit